MINAHDIVFVTLGLTSPALCLPHSQFLLSPLYSHRLVFICKLFIKQKNRKEKKAKKKQKREKKNKTKQKSYFLLTHYLLSVMTLLYAESAWHALYKYGLIVLVYVIIFYQYHCIEVKNITRICASLGSRMRFKTLCYPVFGRNKNSHSIILISNYFVSFQYFRNMSKQLLAPGGLTELSLFKLL